MVLAGTPCRAAPWAPYWLRPCPWPHPWPSSVSTTPGGNSTVSSAWAAGLLAGGGSMLQVSAAQAEETVLLPPGVVLTLEGHGWGHGHGLSQYGAQGAALQGVPASTILATYYPGTTAGHLADSPMRVLVQESLPDQLQVAATSGLAVVDADTGTTYALPARPARWRLVSGGAGLAVQSGDGSRWQPWTAPNGRSAFGSRATFAGPNALRPLGAVHG